MQTRPLSVAPTEPAVTNAAGPARFSAITPAAVKARAKAMKKARKKAERQEQRRFFFSWCSCFHALGFSF